MNHNHNWWLKIDWNNSYNTDTISRPTENLAFRNIEEMVRLIKKHGHNLYFTDFEWKIFELDRHLQFEIIPRAELEIERVKKAGLKTKVRKPNITHEIADKTNHTAEYISKCFDNIEEKIKVREMLGMNPIPDKKDKNKIVKYARSNRRYHKRLHR